MKQFFTVFKFELAGYMKNKLFIITTVAIVVAIAAILSYPRLAAVLDKNDISLPSGEEEVTKIAVKNDSDIPSESLISALSAAFGEEYEVSLLSDKTDEEIESSVKSGDYDNAMIVKSQTSYKYIVDTVGMYDVESNITSAVLLNIHRQMYMASSGLTGEQINHLLTSNVDCETVVTGKDQTQSFLYTYVILMVLYMVLLLYGQFVSTSVASEKSSRAMEVLVTSSKPLNLMFGKILGSGCAGLIQLIVIIFTAYGFYKLNEGVIDNEIVSSIFGMPLSAALYTVLFFILGFFIYAFIYGAAGSLATRTEDLNTLTMPITLIYIAAFMIAMFSMTSGAVDGTLMKVCSYIPTFAPLAMLVRVCMGDVAVYEIVISIVIQVLSIAGLGVLCAKIYRAGVLMYGNTPKVRDIFKILKDAKTL